MNDPDRVFGFDGAAGDDTSLVVMHRDPDGNWKVEQVDGPDAVDLAQLAGDIFAQRTPPEWETTFRGWGEWLAEQADGAGFALTDWQRSIVCRAYAALIREGKLAHQNLLAGRPA